MPSSYEYTKAWREANREKYNEACRRHREKHLEKRRLISAESARKMRAKNPEANRAAKKRHYEKWMATTPPEVRAAQFRLKKYGLTEDQYEQMVRANEGKCSICLKEQPLVIDHCHANGHVRGLLCANCNNALGLMLDSPENLVRASEYLLADARNHG